MSSLFANSCFALPPPATVASPVSPTFPKQMPSHITTRSPYSHHYRPFRVPASTPTSAHDILTNLLRLGHNIPQGAFLPQPSHTHNTKPRFNLPSRIDRVDPIDHSEKQHAPPRRRETIRVAASLGRGPSHSSTTSTVKPSRPSKPKSQHRPLVLQVPSSADAEPKLVPECAQSSDSSSSSSTNSEDESVDTPLTSQVIELPQQQQLLVPHTPLHPPTPLDIPVDWDDLCVRWKPAAPSELGEPAEPDSPLEDRFDGPVHAFAAGASVSRPLPTLAPLTTMTSKDLGEYFSVGQVGNIDALPTSSLFAPVDWVHAPTCPVPGAKSTKASPLPTPVRHPKTTKLPLAPPSPACPLPQLPPADRNQTNGASTPSGRPARRHARLVSLDDAQLVMRTVRFSSTLDPKFDYTNFSKGVETVNPTQAQSQRGTPPKPKIAAGESFFQL